jgi:Spy/CpxP family protein refolding chaperone
MPTIPLRTRLTAALAGTVLLTSVASAQGAGAGAPPAGQPPAGAAQRPRQAQPPRPGQAPQRIEVEVQRRQGMGRAARGTPAAMLLSMRAPLALTPEQVTRLEALRDAPRPDGQASDMLRARADLMDAMKGDGNLPAARAAMDRMAKLRTDRAIAGLKARQDARAVLTPAQKTKLDNLRRQAAGRLRANRRGGAGRGGRAGGMRGPGRMGGMGSGMRRPGAMGPGGMRGPGGAGPMGMRGPGGPEQVIEERIINNGREQVIRRQVRPPEPPVSPISPVVP